eukprot:5465856-Karenia_brevis.AAC.1
MSRTLFHWHQSKVDSYGQAGTLRSSARLALMDWHVSNVCAMHAGHNSLKWALAAQMKDARLMKDIFI